MKKVVSFCTCPVGIKVNSAIFQDTKSQLNRDINIAKLYSEIFIVDRGVKQAWLCDLFCINPLHLIKYLVALKDERFLQKTLHVVQVSNDILVVNLLELYEKINKILINLQGPGSIDKKDVPLFVEYRNIAQFPELTVNTKNMLQESLTVVKNGIEKYHKTNNIENLNFNLGEMTPTIFGIALDYPVVYIQMEEGNTAPDILDLHVVESKINVKNIAFHECDIHSLLLPPKVNISYSFSMPKNVQSYSMDLVTKWKNKLFQKSMDNSNMIIEIVEKDLKNNHVIL